MKHRPPEFIHAATAPCPVSFPCLSLIATALVAANLVHAEVPASAPFTPEQQQLIRQISASEVKAATPAMASAAAATVEDKTQNIETAKEVLEIGRNQLNLWLGYLGVLTGAIGLFGIAVPLFTVKKYKDEIDKQAEELRAKLKLAENALADAQKAQEKTKTAQQRAEAALQKVDIAQQNIAEAQTKAGEAQQHAESIQKHVEAALELARIAQERAEQHTCEIETLLTDAHNKTNLIPNADTVTGDLKAEVLAKLQQHKPPQVVALIQQAVEKYQKQDWVAAKPLYELLSLVESHEPNVWFNLGVVLQKTQTDMTKVIECYQRSDLLQPNVKALHNWSIALFAQAKKLTGDAQQQRFVDACEKCAEAYRLTSDYVHKSQDDAQVLCNWGVILFEHAKRLTGGAQQQRFAEACEKYAEAKNIKSDDASIYLNLAIVLRAWAGTLKDNECDAKLAEAAAHQQKAEELERQVS